MEGHAKKCVERYCELANKDDSTTLQSYLLLVVNSCSVFIGVS